MSSINLGYGKSSIKVEFDEEKFSVLGKTENQKPLSDVEINEKLDAPIDSKTIEEIIKPDETVLIVVPDATRKSASGQVVNLLVRRLIANGTMPFDISIIFATGIHRAVTEEEKSEILTPFIVQRVKTLDHNARDLMQFVRFGETSGGITVELNRALDRTRSHNNYRRDKFSLFRRIYGRTKIDLSGLGFVAHDFRNS